MTRNSIQTESLRIIEANGVAARRCLAYAGDYPADATAAVYGVTRAAAANGEMAPIDVLGRIEVEASAAVAVGAEVQSGADGRVATKADGNFVVGRVVKAAAAAGDICEIVRGV